MTMVANDAPIRSRLRRVTFAAAFVSMVMFGAACGARGTVAAGQPHPGGSGVITRPGDGSGTAGVPPSGGGSAPPTHGISVPPATEGSGSTPGGFSEDELKTYAYALSDEATVATDLEAMSATATALQADLNRRDIPSAKTDASSLLAEANGMDTDAGSATDRMQPLKPSDESLKQIRTDALSAFGLTEAYASTAVDLSNAVLDMSMQQLASVLKAAADLRGTTSELTG